MNTAWLLVAVGLLAGTYLVRAVPFWFNTRSSLSPRIRRFLEVVPAAALGALIAPDAFLSGSPFVGSVVVTISIALGLKGVGITPIVAVGIIIAWIAGTGLG